MSKTIIHQNMHNSKDIKENGQYDTSMRAAKTRQI